MIIVNDGKGDNGDNDDDNEEGAEIDAFLWWEK